MTSVHLDEQDDIESAAARATAPARFRHPGTRHYPRDRRLALRHVRVEVDVDVAARTLRGSCSLTVVPLGRAELLELDARDLRIARVEVDGHTAPHAVVGDVLRVTPARPLVPGAPATVMVAYATSPERGLHFVGPDRAHPGRPTQAWSQGQADNSSSWFPCIDAPDAKATTEVIAWVPAGMTAISNGVKVLDEHHGDRRRIGWRLDRPHSCYLVSLVIGRFDERRSRHGGVELAVHARPELAARAARTCRRTGEMMDLFSSVFGFPYPYSSYAQVFVADFVFGATENTTATTLMEDYLPDEAARADHDPEWCVAHELSHQWFGNLVTAHDWSEVWLHEGFATYAEYLWRRHSEGLDAAAMDLDALAARFFADDARQRRPLVDRVCDRPMELFDRRAYDKGGWVAHMLHALLGEADFTRSLRRFLSDRQDASAVTADLCRAVRQETGRAIEWFLEQWVTVGQGFPELDVSYRWDAARRVAELTVVQTQIDAGVPWFRLPTAVRFRVGAADVDRAIVIDGATCCFRFELEAEPSHVVFDPGKHLLARVRPRWPVELELGALTGASEAIDRVHAARALAADRADVDVRVDLGADADVDARVPGALRAALTGDSFWGVRAEAATALGRLAGAAVAPGPVAGAGDDCAALVAALAAEPDARVRRAAATALGRFPGDPRAAASLACAIERGDPSDHVLADACHALGRHGPAHGPLLEATLRRASFLDVVARGALRGLAEARSAGAGAAIRAALAPTGSSHVRRTAALAAATLARGGHEAEMRGARELLEALLRDRDLLVVEAAVEALELLARPEAAPAIRGAMARDREGRLRRRCYLALHSLDHARAAAAPAPGRWA